MPDSLIQPLVEGPLDLIGDVHGEIDALRSLLQHLGYDDDGNHPEDRHLVFLGDLTDRGPGSPAVVELVQSLVNSERAQCVLGNHDLNILLGAEKHDNHWFFGEEWSLEGDGHPITPAKLADEKLRGQIQSFFKTLPLALEREDLRVVHACWDDDAVSLARDSNDADALYKHHEQKIKDDHNSSQESCNTTRNLDHQNGNPVKLLTSGREQKAAEPFFASGKWRNEERVAWWKDEQNGPTCVFGHYSIPDGQFRGAGSAFCVDFGVARRWTERRDGTTSGFESKLAALRWPERFVVFDEGQQRSAVLPSWQPDGGIVLDVLVNPQGWSLPADATVLPSFHVTLLGRKVLLEQTEMMEEVWPSLRRSLPLPPLADLTADVHRAVDEDRQTWFLSVTNQQDFRDYVEELAGRLDEAFSRKSGRGFTNPESDRFFHVSIANDQAGDPLKSIGSIRPSERR